MKKIVVLLSLLALVGVFPISTFATVTIQLDGKVYQNAVPSVLGDKDEKKDEQKEEKKEEVKKEEKRDESKQEMRKEEPRKEEQKGVEKIEPQERRIEFKVNKEMGRIKEVQIERGKEKVEIQIEREELEKQEKVEDTELEVETDDGVVKIASGEAEEELEVEHKGVKAQTEFPLRIDPITKQLTATTPVGTKNVSILPEKAAAVISELGLIDNASGASKLKMKFENGQLVYKIEGTKKKKLFGIIPFTVKQDAVVSAETGAMVSKSELTLFERIMSVFAR